MRYRDDGAGPIVELFAMENTPAGPRPGQYLGACYARMLLQHRELAKYRGVRIGSAELQPAAAIQLIDQLNHRIAAQSISTVANVSQSPRLPSTAKHADQLKVSRVKQASPEKVVTDVASALLKGLASSEMSTVGLRVSGPRL